jgi:hypothetical protein
LLQSYSFPASFAQLTRLQSLCVRRARAARHAARADAVRRMRACSNVTSNIFSGPLPAFLGLLPLTSLAVARNSFTGACHSAATGAAAQRR